MLAMENRSSDGESCIIINLICFSIIINDIILCYIVEEFDKNQLYMYWQRIGIFSEAIAVYSHLRQTVRGLQKKAKKCLKVQNSQPVFVCSYVRRAQSCSPIYCRLFRYQPAVLPISGLAMHRPRLLIFRFVEAANLFITCTFNSTRKKKHIFFLYSYVTVDCTHGGTIFNV